MDNSIKLLKFDKKNMEIKIVPNYNIQEIIVLLYIYIMANKFSLLS